MKKLDKNSASVTSNRKSTAAKTATKKTSGKKGKVAPLAVANDISPAQQAFVQAVENKVSSAFSSWLDGTFTMLNYPAGFNWGVQFGPNNFYNPSSLNEIDLQVITGSNGIPTLGASNFSSVYDQVLNAISYVISDADNQVINKEAQSAASQISSVISTWEENFGTVTQSQIQNAVPPSKLGYIVQQVTKLWGNDVRNIPSSVNDFRIAYQSYQVIAAQSNQILSRSGQAMSQLQEAIANTENPSASNGGLQTGATSYYVGYTGFPAQNMINSGLQTLTNQVSVSISLSDFSSSSSNLSIEGSAGFTIPVDDIFEVSINGSASFDLSKYSSSSTTMDMSVVYQGVTFISSAPENLNLAGTQGWYSNLILEEAVQNMGKGTSVTGYQLQGGEFSPSDFGPGGKLSRLKTFVICQQPQINLTFHQANSSLVKSDFQEQATADVSLFGLFDVGSVSESYEVQNVSSSGSDGSVTVTLGPPTIIGTTPAQQATAFVLGGVASYPPNNV